MIDGVAVQLRRTEPRTTLDIDLAVISYEHLPQEALSAEEFRLVGLYAHSENWLGPDDVPVQFSDDPAFALAISTAEDLTMHALRLRVATARELVRAKLRAATDQARRRSKRWQDLADIAGLLEDNPSLLAAMTAAEQSQLAALLSG